MAKRPLEGPAAQTVSRSSSTVTVACKVAVAWIDLELCEERTVSENTQTGPRDIKVWARTGRMVRIRGTAYPRGEPPEGFPDKPSMASGCALTAGVPRDFWEQWSHQHRLSPLIKNGMIFADENLAEVKAIAAEQKGKLSGLEPVARNKDGITDPRIPRSSNKAISEIAPSDRPSAA